VIELNKTCFAKQRLLRGDLCCIDLAGMWVYEEIEKGMFRTVNNATPPWTPSCYMYLGERNIEPYGRLLNPRYTRKFLAEDKIVYVCEANIAEIRITG
jgi:hypothetical protein